MLHARQRLTPQAGAFFTATPFSRLTLIDRLTTLRTYAGSELLGALNLVIIPALIGPLLGATVGGLIVHILSWHEIFFVNLPVGLFALWMILRHIPDGQGDAPRPRGDVPIAETGSLQDAHLSRLGGGWLRRTAWGWAGCPSCC